LLIFFRSKKAKNGFIEGEEDDEEAKIN